MAHGYPDFEGGKRGLYSVADWAAYEGVDKNFAHDTAALTWGGSEHLSYSVPEGKTLFISGMSFTIFPESGEDADNNQIGEIHLINATTLEAPAVIGGNGGGGIVFSKPVRFKAEEELQLYVVCKANHICFMRVTCWGYEV